eukprot:8048306-Karenia_brevis.AAC.1
MALCNAMLYRKQLLHIREIKKFPFTHVQEFDHGLESHSIPCALGKGVHECMGAKQGPADIRVHRWKAGASGHTGG